MTFLTVARPCLGHIRDTAFWFVRNWPEIWMEKILVSNIKRRRLSIYSSAEFDRQRESGDFLRLRDSAGNNDNLVDVELIALALYQIIKNEKLV